MSELDPRLLGDSYMLARSLNLVNKPALIIFFSGDMKEYLGKFEERREMTAAVVQEYIDDRDRSLRE